MGKVRVIGGVHRSRILRFSDNISGLRPTLDHVRETLFNWLGQDMAGKNFLDLFAGSGALGFEAISRHAKLVTMVEQNLQIVKDLRANQTLLKCNNLNIIVGNGLKYLAHCACDFDVLFLDPPYMSDLLDQCLHVIYKRREEMQRILIYIEYENLPPMLKHYTIIKEKKISKLNYALLTLMNDSPIEK